MTLRLILGDQLNPQHSWFRQPDPAVRYVMMELRQETDYVRHHIQKITGFFLAMRAFAAELQAQGHQVHYITLDDPANTQSLTGNLDALMQQWAARRFEYLLPDEYRLDQQLRQYAQALPVPSAAADTEHFLTERDTLARLFAGKKTYLMETFYRAMRKRHRILMETDTEPLTGRWNYDAENRSRYDGAVPVPEPPPYVRDVQALVRMIQAMGVQSFGNVEETRFIWPVTRQEALDLLEFFVQQCLPWFGRYQDAMVQQHWSLFHARLSFVLNIKLLHPMEVIGRAVAAWEAEPERISIAQVEGFVRQIAGWREYMRGVYWAQMPGYASQNYFGHSRPLPAWYWTGETKMNCLRHAIGQSLDYAYAHHIQRLMVTGNFALLAGIDPAEVDAWYLGVYIDAIEWVEITNTRGMSQYADGGLVGSKPYVSTAAYIDKMSDYCGSCAYSRKLRHGPGACPFNSLYWHFYHRHAELLARNPRIGFAYKTLQAMSEAERSATLAQAEAYLARLDEL
ncbi:MAG: cryptochrome/photolyase family protein [Bacteroidia bacterium]|nr:cryptochrome/photolyase family protein [Bacteroidia bacterium]